MDEQELQNGGTQVVDTPTTTMAEGNAASEQQPQEKMYSKAEVQDLMRRRVERSHNAFFKRYGVTNLDELDEFMRKSRTFGDDYLSMKELNNNLTRENAFLRNNINPDKYDDIIAYFKGNNVEFAEEQLIEALKTHPEWLKQKTTIQTMGNEFHNENLPSDKERASKILGVNL